MKIKILLLLLPLLFVTRSAQAQNGSEYLIKANRATLERRYDDALMYYNQYIAVNPEDFRGYFNKGTTLYNAERFPEAIAAFSKTLSLNPIYKEAIYYRGKSQIGNKDYQSAIADFSKILDKDDANVPFLKLRAEAYALNKQNDLAIKDLTTAISYDKLNGDLYKRRAIVKVAMEKYESAIRDYNSVEKLLPKYKMVHYIKGNLYLKLDDEEFACEEFQKALDAGVVIADRKFQEHCKVVPKEVED